MEQELALGWDASLAYDACLEAAASMACLGSGALGRVPCLPCARRRKRAASKVALWRTPAPLCPQLSCCPCYLHLLPLQARPRALLDSVSRSLSFRHPTKLHEHGINMPGMPSQSESGDNDRVSLLLCTRFAPFSYL